MVYSEKSLGIERVPRRMLSSISCHARYLARAAAMSTYWWPTISSEIPDELVPWVLTDGPQCPGYSLRIFITLSTHWWSSLPWVLTGGPHYLGYSLVVFITLGVLTDGPSALGTHWQSSVPWVLTEGLHYPGYLLVFPRYLLTVLSTWDV